MLVTTALLVPGKDRVPLLETFHVPPVSVARRDS